MVKLKRLWNMANLLLPLGLIGVLKSVRFPILAQPRCHLSFAHAIVYGQATTGRKELNVFMRSRRVPYILRVEWEK